MSVTTTDKPKFTISALNSADSFHPPNEKDKESESQPEPPQEQEQAQEQVQPQPQPEQQPPQPELESVPPELTEKDQEITEEAINDEPEPETFLQFRKKNVKPRTQSFQSVLSTASLKSLNQPQPNRNNSVISTTSNTNNNKNFQSFIQAPVLSSIPNLKNDDFEIGRQLPFDHNKSKDKPLPAPEENGNDDDSYDDQETIIQQQRLTLNALKKLSLSPLPRIAQDPGEVETTGIHSRSIIRELENNKSRKTEPYQPAAVDLSTFSSLTRQPNVNQRTLSKSDEQDPSLTPASVTSTTSSQPPQPLASLANQKYHAEVLQSHQNNLNNLKLQTKNSLLSDLAQRRRSQNLPMATVANRIPSPLNTPTGPAPPLRSSPTVPQSQTVPSVQNGTRAISDGYFNHTNQNQPQPPIKQKHLKQIKGLRSPMYVPAVLRKTIDEYRQETGDGTKASSQDVSSAASLRSVDSNASIDSRSSSPILSSTTGPSTKTFRSYEHMLRQPPTRRHWMKDESAYKCGITTCDKEFNFFERRHHCRKCGGIFCKEHTSHYLYINHLAQFTTGGRGTLSRVCDNCIQEYNEFVRNQFGVNITKEPKKPDFYQSNFSATAIPNKHVNVIESERQDSTVGSVPANWSWSSF